MSCSWVGYVLVMPEQPDIAAGKAAFGKIKEHLAPRLEAAKAWEESDDPAPEDTAADELIAAVEDMLTDPYSECPSDSSDVRLLLDYAEDALASISEQWPPDYSDGTYRKVGDKLVLVAGGSTWGDSPDGEGYNLLRGLTMFKSVADALGVE